MGNAVDSQGNQIKYEGFPFISNIDKYVQNELANRSLQRIRAIVPYVKVTPGFSPDGTEAGKIVLKGIEAPNDRDPSTYQFNELYRPNSFFRPLAGVKSITSDYLNAFGSIKKVTISWVCHTLEDLERLSPYFLNPGQSMFVEWGWDNYAKRVISNTPKVNLADYLTYVRDRKKLSNGNYDAMLGIVVNYSFALNRDGGFDCSTEVVSSGFVMEGITIPNQITQDASGNSNIKTVSTVEGEQKQKENEENQKTETDKQKIKVLDTLQNFMENGFYAQIKAHLNDAQNRFTQTNQPHDYFLLTEKNSKNGISKLVEGSEGRTAKAEKTEQGESLQSGYSPSNSGTNPIAGTGTQTKVVVEIPLRASVYASWGYLEDYVLNPHLAIQCEGTEKLLFGFDSRGSKISSHQNLRTTDLGVCIVPIANPGGNSLDVPNFKAGETNEKNLEFGYVRRLLINVEYFREVLLNATTVNDAVLQVFSGINDACINYWQFRLAPIEEKFDDSGKQDTSGTVTSTGQPVTTSDFQNQGVKAPDRLLGSNRKDAIIAQKIVDVNYGDRLFEEIIGEGSGLYTFRTKTFALKNEETGQTNPNVTSVVRNLVFESKLSSQAALNVFYSAQNKDGRVMGSPSNNTFKSLYNFTINGIDYSKAKDTFSAGPYEAIHEGGDADVQQTDKDRVDPGTETELFIIAQAAYGEKFIRFLPWGNADDSKSKGYWVLLVKDGQQIHLTGKEGMKMAVLLSIDGKESPGTSEALVPLECQVELEGISGIRIGDIFTIDHLPQIYRNHGTFQVIGITDTVDKNSWVTKLKAGFRVFRNIDYAKAVNSPQTYVATETIKNAVSTAVGNTLDPAPKINPNHVGRYAATYTPVYMARHLDIRNYTKEDILGLVNKGTLVEIGDAKNNTRFQMGESATKLNGKYYLERKAAEQFKSWYSEMAASGINFSVSSAARFGANTGAGPHGYCIAVDFANLWLNGGDTSAQSNLNARIKSIDYTRMATAGAKYGWYNPWRLSDVYGVDELWHFEYWGPA